MDVVELARRALDPHRRLERLMEDILEATAADWKARPGYYDEGLKALAADQEGEAGALLGKLWMAISADITDGGARGDLLIMELDARHISGWQRLLFDSYPGTARDTVRLMEIREALGDGEFDRWFASHE